MNGATTAVDSEARNLAILRTALLNEEFTAWLTGQKSMSFGKDGEHTTVRLIDTGAPEANTWTISTEVAFEQGRIRKRFDLVLWCNGFPLVVGEVKALMRPAYTWIDAAAQSTTTMR